MPQQCGTSRGASARIKGSDVLNVPNTSSAAIPTRTSSCASSPAKDATTTCFGGRSGLRPSVNAMSTTGTIEPRRLNTPIKKLGAKGMRVTDGHSTTSSTSNTDKQNRSRPARKMQYCRSVARSAAAKSDGTSPSSGDVGCCCSEFGNCSGTLYKPLYCSQQFGRGERLNHIAVRSLLLCPKLVAFRVL